MITEHVDNAGFGDISTLLGDLPSDAAKRVAVSALTLFSRTGFHSTTTRDIAIDAKVSAGALYTYFSSKEDILYRWMLAGHNSVLTLAKAALHGGSDPEAQVYAVVYGITHWHAVHWTLSRVIGQRLADLSAEHYQTIRDLRIDIENCLHVPILDGTASGEFNPTDTRVALNAIFALMLDVSRWFRSHDITPEEVSDQFTKLSLAMLKAGV